MHKTQEKILEKAREYDLSVIPLRKIAELIEQPAMSPGVLQHHIAQLEKKSLLFIDRKAKTQRFGEDISDERFFLIPIVGSANCGPATEVAEENIEGYLRVSKKSLTGVSSELIAVRAVGSSMNDAKVITPNGSKAPIEEGDLIIVDRQRISIADNLNKYVLSIIGGMANIKKLVKRQYDIALLSESKDQKSYPPILIHEGEDYLVNGGVVGLVKA